MLVGSSLFVNKCYFPNSIHRRENRVGSKEYRGLVSCINVFYFSLFLRLQLFFSLIGSKIAAIKSPKFEISQLQNSSAKTGFRNSKAID